MIGLVFMGSFVMIGLVFMDIFVSELLAIFVYFCVLDEILTRKPQFVYVIRITKNLFKRLGKVAISQK